ncbi:splicing factor YJU2-like [Homarus americanus]|uniref:Splicing factor YJU2 n=1 Tax=Homarus americanus TaxID=6706 RepID=A0A8J5N172_HOMAM|nr:splicing factor YJU2-like [Homarus americanus]XP_042237096.1 splicing factor YJU2-like [Homarus americanus]KAG7171157.1 Splicing factor YJU2-like 2 [Homarus americanus]
MSERKVLNKYYPPDFDPSKIPRARCPRNRQFTVRLMVPCNIKCYTCGEYIAKGKKFNARKEDVENMTYLGVRIYRFYIKCPGCLAEISFRTDPESTDYVIEAGAHRNFQALKLAEEQAAREEREAREEIESNPMLLLENRTQQSQYEMEVLESLEDLREMNDRHAGIDLGKIAEKFETERKMTQEQVEEAERLAALQALGYEMIEGQMVKRVAPEELEEEKPLKKKIKIEKDTKVTDVLTSSSLSVGDKFKKGNMKSRLAGMIKIKDSQTKRDKSTNEPKGPKSTKLTDVPLPNTSKPVVPLSSSDKSVDKVSSSTSVVKDEVQNVVSKGPSGLSFLGAYSDSESDESN